MEDRFIKGSWTQWSGYNCQLRKSLNYWLSETWRIYQPKIALYSPHFLSSFLQAATAFHYQKQANRLDGPFLWSYTDSLKERRGNWIHVSQILLRTTLWIYINHGVDYRHIPYRDKAELWRGGRKEDDVLCIWQVKSSHPSCSFIENYISPLFFWIPYLSQW